MPGKAQQLRKSLVQFGAIGEEQQLYLLAKILKKSKEGVKITRSSVTLLAALEATLQAIAASENVGKEKLSASINAIKRLIAKIESSNTDSALIKRFVKLGLYRMLYHNPTLKGIDDTDLRTLVKSGFIGVGISAIVVILFTVVSLVGAPLWITVIATALFSSSVAYLSALLYGVVNDLIATRSNLAYFLLGHQPQQHSVLPTNDPSAQGIAWGILATFGPAFIASIVFGVAILITAAFVPIATFLAPVMLIVTPLIALVADIFAKFHKKKYLVDYDMTDEEIGSNDYQRNGLKKMSPNNEDKAAWIVNGYRNGFGYLVVPIVGVCALATIVTLSAVSTFLPVALFSAIIATIIPVVFATVAILALAGAGIYIYVNRNKQIDNRYKLEFKKELKASDELYMDEDTDLIIQLLDDYKRVEKLEPEPDIHHHRLFSHPHGFRPISLELKTDAPCFT